MSQIELNRRRIMAVISGSGYEAVDLGLPSGKKWANMNIGATKPEEDGLYFSWGNVEGHAKDSGYIFDKNNYDSTTGSEITTDLDLTHDAAHNIMGDSWRMPTIIEFKEMENNTDREWVADYEGTGKNGYKFMKKTDHNVFIFIPASGMFRPNLTDYNSILSLWSSEVNSGNTTQARYTIGASSYINVGLSQSRFYGYSIRAIQD